MNEDYNCQTPKRYQGPYERIVQSMNKRQPYQPRELLTPTQANLYGLLMRQKTYKQGKTSHKRSVAQSLDMSSVRPSKVLAISIVPSAKSQLQSRELPNLKGIRGGQGTIFTSPTAKRTVEEAQMVSMSYNDNDQSRVLETKCKLKNKKLPKVESTDFNTAQGKFHIGEREETLLAGQLKYDEKKTYQQAIKQEIQSYGKIASNRYSPHRNRSIMMSDGILGERDSIMRGVAVHQMKLKHLNEFRRQEMDRILSQRLVHDEEQLKINQQVARQLGEDLSSSQLEDRWNRQNFKLYLESLCLRSTRSVVDEQTGYQIIAFQDYRDQVAQKIHDAVVQSERQVLFGPPSRH